MMIHVVRASLILAVIVLNPAFAGARDLVLRGDVLVYRDIVNVGDFFDDAGKHADKPLFRAPDLGHRGSVPVWQVQDRMLELGLTKIDTRGLTAVQVTRASQYLTGTDFVEMTKLAIAERLGGVRLENLDMQVDGVPDAVHADAGANEPVSLRRLNYSNRSGRFFVQYSVDNGSRRQEVTLRGSARETRRTVVLTRPVGRGETIAATDVIEARLLARDVSQHSAVTAGQLIGMEARRNLQDNTSISLSDVQPPTLIERNQAVVITYKSTTMILSSQGRALASGAKGDLINVLNLQSKRTIQGRVIGAGEVMVLPRTFQLATAKE